MVSVTCASSGALVSRYEDETLDANDKQGANTFSVYVYVYMYVHIYVCVRVCVCMYVCTCVRTYVRTYVRMHIRMFWVMIRVL